LVDLAGSERLKKTMDAMEYIPGHEITKKESMSINQSLSYLEQCVIALARKSSHVPYRQSKLTNILKDFFEAFAGDKKKFTKNVLANIDDNDVWRVGFITQEDMSEFDFKDYVAVYIPMAYSVAGNVYIIPKHRVKPITNISASESMKFAVSGGVTSIEE
jgi:hypothetical protein